MSVHDIDVDGCGATALGCGYLVGQVGEVGGEDGGKQLDHGLFMGTSKGKSPSGQVYQRRRVGVHEGLQLRTRSAVQFRY